MQIEQVQRASVYFDRFELFASDQPWTPSRVCLPALFAISKMAHGKELGESSWKCWSLCCRLSNDNCKFELNFCTSALLKNAGTRRNLLWHKN